MPRKGYNDNSDGDNNDYDDNDNNDIKDRNKDDKKTHTHTHTHTHTFIIPSDFKDRFTKLYSTCILTSDGSD